MCINPKILIITLTSIFSFSQVGMASISQEVLFTILSNEDSCVKQYDDNKVYLNPENICVAQNGLFLHINGYNLVQLPMLQSDNNGCWIATNSWDIEVLNHCPHCGKRYFVRCRNPDCPSNQR